MGEAEKLNPLICKINELINHLREKIEMLEQQLKTTKGSQS